MAWHPLIQFSWRIVKWEVTTWKDWIPKPCHVWAPLLFVYINLINIFGVKVYRTAVLCSSSKLLFLRPLCRQDAHHSHVSLEGNSLQNNRSWAKLLSPISQQVSSFNTTGCQLLNLETDSSSFKILLQELQEIKHQFWAQCPPDGICPAHMLWALHSVGLRVCSLGPQSSTEVIVASN